MNHQIQLANLIHLFKNPPPRLRSGYLFIALALAWLALSPAARAVDPPPDGGYPNQNTAEGDGALLSLTSGSNNTAIGFQTLLNNTFGHDNTANGVNALLSNVSGFNNTAIGNSALGSMINGAENTAIGFEALFHNFRSDNTATGFRALFGNTDGIRNTATGSRALFSNTTGSRNTATGFETLVNNGTGTNNTATGFRALARNTKGEGNTAMGTVALEDNTTGSLNIAVGSAALVFNTTGSANIAIGQSALQVNRTGSNNTAVGIFALDNSDGSDNTAIGSEALTHPIGDRNIALGNKAGQNLTTGSDNIDIGNPGVAGEANTIRIGTTGTQNQTFIAGISGMTVPGGVGVIIDSNGHLGTVTSSERFKTEIKPMAKASEAILSLKPVTFHYKHELDPHGIPQFGLVAEQVEKVNPDLVARDEEGKAYTVRYEAVNAMLLNEFLKEHRKVQTLEGMVTQQQKQIEALTTGLQKVSDQLEVTKHPAQMVANDQ